MGDEETGSSLYVGVIISITGNILISVALNIQKYSHNKNEKSGVHVPYMKRKLWWLGLILMLLGEVGNFLAYAFAPPSIVAPLGTVALVTNAIIAPFVLKEKFRIQDLIGILLSIAGAVIVVLFSASSDKKFTLEKLLEALSQTQFLVYVGISIGGLALLLFLSYKYGNKFLFINMTIVGLFGGYTVIATKAISSLLTQDFLQIFTYWIFYIMVIILVVTGVLQVRYLQKALQVFDSTEVIPAQFVMFTVFAIISGGVLYNDFEGWGALNIGLFLLGISLTFAGVFLISQGRKTLREASGTLTSSEDIEGEPISDENSDDDIQPLEPGVIPAIKRGFSNMTGAIKEGFDNRLVAIKAGMEQIRQNYQRDGEFIRLTKKRKPSNNTTQVTETYPEYQEHSNGHHRNLEPELSGIDEEQTFIFAKDVTDSETRDKDD